jgi:GxxExxY protein
VVYLEGGHEGCLAEANNRHYDILWNLRIPLMNTCPTAPPPGVQPMYDKLQASERDPQTYAIIGAAMEVHRELGSGFLEPVYQKAMEVELADRQLPAQPQAEIVVLYKGRPLPDVAYRPDFICFGDIIVELKALPAITGVERAQLLNYLKATGFRRGLLNNFGSESLQFERMVYG